MTTSFSSEVKIFLPLDDEACFCSPSKMIRVMRVFHPTADQSLYEDLDLQVVWSTRPQSNCHMLFLTGCSTTISDVITLTEETNRYEQDDLDNNQYKSLDVDILNVFEETWGFFSKNEGCGKCVRSADARSWLLTVHHYKKHTNVGPKGQSEQTRHIKPLHHSHLCIKTHREGTGPATQTRKVKVKYVQSYMHYSTSRSKFLGLASNAMFQLMKQHLCLFKHKPNSKFLVTGSRNYLLLQTHGIPEVDGQLTNVKKDMLEGHLCVQGVHLSQCPLHEGSSSSDLSSSSESNPDSMNSSTLRSSNFLQDHKSFKHSKMISTLTQVQEALVTI
ncbi:hypothetical protein DNTS_024248 [Danionella cerebrum]|uniref:Uncharacterized protein n=1 Tax=Danionella cerebrum TaxID=2873325 RepID=A0A553R355_9TELE|nr:hypothetical protein DNTS_024248 [Danionella translucida]